MIYKGKGYDEEVWTEIEGFERYLISNYGRVWSKRGERVLKTWISNCGYELVGLTVNSKTTKVSIHRLVAKHFIPNHNNKEQVNHIDGNKINNKAQNLEWSTQSENMRHANKNGLTRDRKGNNSFYHKVNEDDVLKIRKMYATGNYLMREIAEMYGVTRHTIGKIIRRKNWKHI